MFVGGLSWETSEGKTGLIPSSGVCDKRFFVAYIYTRFTITCTSLRYREHEKVFRAVWGSGRLRCNERRIATPGNQEKQVGHLFAKWCFWLTSGNQGAGALNRVSPMGQ